ncbi:MAG: 4Fe-4S binding protein [Desulfobacterales bacterium]
MVDHEKCIGCGTCARYCSPVVHYQVPKWRIAADFHRSAADAISEHYVSGAVLD